MNIFIYSDESGVFDKKHNDIFVFGGLIFLSKENKDVFSKKYIAAEKIIRKKEHISDADEVKAAKISKKSRGQLFRAINGIEKFGIIIDQNMIYDSITSAKKSKQRYLDWAYKFAVRKKMEALIKQEKINPNEIEKLYFYIDEHTTATNGKYELKESIEQEFRHGMYDNRGSYYPPLFENLNRTDVIYCDSRKITLVRAADIVANRLYFLARTNAVIEKRNFHIFHHPLKQDAAF